MTETRVATIHASHPQHLLHPRLIGPGATLLAAAFVTDLIYWRTHSYLWETFSIWLITGGLILAVLSVLALVIDLGLRRMEAIDWLRFAGLAVAVLLSLFNAFIHSRDGYTAVMPVGIALSGIVTILLIVLGWRGWSLCAFDRFNRRQPRSAHP